jgi:excisionase family DNA binding protein
MRRNNLEVYDRRVTDAVLDASDRKLDAILEILQSRSLAEKPVQPMAMPPKLNARLALGVKEAARTIGVSPDSIRRHITAGNLKAVRFGKRVLIRREELEKLIGGSLQSRVRDSRDDPLQLK